MSGKQKLPNRARPIQLKVWISEEERDLLERIPARERAQFIREQLTAALSSLPDPKKAQRKRRSRAA